MESTLERVFRTRREVLGAGWENATYDRFLSAVFTNALSAAREFLREDGADPTRPLERAAQWSLLALESRRGAPFVDFDEFQLFALAPAAFGKADATADIQDVFRDHVLVHASAFGLEHAEMLNLAEPLAENNLTLFALGAVEVIDLLALA